MASTAGEAPTLPSATSSRTNTGNRSAWFVVARWPLALGAGFAQAAMFSPFNQGWLCWVSLPLLLAALWFPESESSPRPLVCAGLGYVAGLGIFLGSLHWITSVHAVGWIALSLYLALYPALWALAAGTIFRPRFPPPGSDLPHPFLSSFRNIGRAAGLAAVWTALEYLRSVAFSGFGWNTLGLGLRDNLPLIQIASVTGAAGLSFLAAFVSISIGLSLRRLILEAGKPKTRAHFDFHAGMLLLAGVFMFGVVQLREPVDTRPLEVSIIQANIPQNQKWNAHFADEILETYEYLTQAAAATDPDLLVWPEAATPVSMFGDERTFRLVTRLSAEAETPLLLGTLDYDEQYDYNAAALIPPGPGQIQVYQKLHLVPFGEYIPFRNSFPLFAWIAGDLVPGDFRSGKHPQNLHLWSHHAVIAPLICFEDTLGQLVTQFAARGAQLLVTVTNDGWFLETAGAEQHLANARLRTVETGLPLIRAANTGVSCLIDHRGRTLRELRDENRRPFVRGILTERIEIPENPRPTFYTLHGDLFSHLCVAACLLPVLLKIGPGRTPKATDARTPR